MGANFGIDKITGGHKPLSKLLGVGDGPCLTPCSCAYLIYPFADKGSGRVGR